MRGDCEWVKNVRTQRQPYGISGRRRKARFEEVIEINLSRAAREREIRPEGWVRGALMRLRHDAQIGFWGRPAAGVLFAGLLIRDRAGDDHILARLPVDRSGDLMFGR